MHIQVRIIRCLLSESPSEREKGIFNPFQNISSIDVEIRFVSTHSERMHPSRLLRFIGAPMRWLRERIYQIKTPAPNENPRESTSRNNTIEYARKGTVGIGRGAEDRNLALGIRSRWKGLQIGLCSKATKQEDSDLR